MCNLQQLKIAVFTYRSPHFCFPWGRPRAITLNVVWMGREFDAYKLSRSMYPSIFNSFPVIRTASAKNRRFHVPQPTFLFPLETLLRLSRNVLHVGKTIQCLPNASQHVPIYLQQFPSYTMLKSMRKSKNRYFLPHFGFPWGRPWGNQAKCCTDGKRIRCLKIVSLHVPI